MGSLFLIKSFTRYIKGSITIEGVIIFPIIILIFSLFIGMLGYLYTSSYLNQKVEECLIKYSRVNYLSGKVDKYLHLDEASLKYIKDGSRGIVSALYTSITKSNWKIDESRLKIDISVRNNKAILKLRYITNTIFGDIEIKKEKLLWS